LNCKQMIRPADRTRQSIMKAAVKLFAEKGYQGASVRDIVAKAGVNQAAINYHFKSKDGLYAELLTVAFEKLTEQAGFDPQELKSLSREEALRRFVHQQLRPLLFRDELSQYIHIFAWESVHPSKPFLKFISANTMNYLASAMDIVQRFLPPGTERRLAVCGAIWLMGQCSTFVRNRELIAREPFKISADDRFVDELADFISRLALGGLQQGTGAVGKAR
jgi:TetR/AcrR family transcriptional regulator, regulator of cefoperazone and chloramphenicol sensitivity